MKSSVEHGTSSSEEDSDTEPRSVCESKQEDKGGYFESYENLDVHRLMLGDQPRTEAYRKAIMENRSLFEGKVVMDVGAGTGILSLFAAEAGAKKVYAIEASSVALLAREIVQRNGFGGIIDVSSCQVEDFMLQGGEKVDILISEWMGFYLVHESMLSSVIFARDKFLKDDGLIFPSKATIYACPSNLQHFYKEEIDCWDNMYGFDFSAVKAPALQSKLVSPQIMLVDHGELLCRPEVVKHFDLKWVTLDDVKEFKVRFFSSSKTRSVCHGIVLWFDCEFPSVSPDCSGVVLSTGPHCPPTHWKQTAVVLPGKIELDEGDILGFDIELSQCESNSRHYDIKVEFLGDEVEHPVPCNCGSARCTLIQAFLQQQQQENEEIMNDAEDVEDIS